MLYRIAHILRDKLPWIWESIGVINSFLFVLRYGKRMKKIKGILKSFIYYDENGIKRMIFTENEAKAYYKSGKKAVFFKYNKSLNLYNLELEDPDEQIAYYEDGRKAMEVDSISKKGRIYHKDGRLFFEYSGSLDNYKRYD